MASPTPESPQQSAADRIRARQEARSAETSKGGVLSPAGFLREIRGWIDALVFAFLLAMFIRTYVFELFMIPTGSMTPTLIGDDSRMVSEFDWDKDGNDDIVVLGAPRYPNNPERVLQVHLKNDDGVYDRFLLLESPSPEIQQMVRDFRGFGESASSLSWLIRDITGRKTSMNRAAGRRDMIMVNKFSYWFVKPTRGDIIVFKTPDRPPRYSFDPAKPVYIKRCVALPSETLELSPIEPREAHPPGHPERITPDSYGGTEFVIRSRPLVIDGDPVEGPIFDHLNHFPVPEPADFYAAYPDVPTRTIDVPDDSVLMFGDNQMSSSDSRYWGAVPLNHLRGKAVLRYMPLSNLGFLQNP